MRWCHKQGYLDADPLLGLQRRPQPRGNPRALDPAQVEALAHQVHVDVSDLRDAGIGGSTVQRSAAHASVLTTARFDRRGEVTKRSLVEKLHCPT